MKKLSSEELQKIIADHKLWIESGRSEGKRAALHNTNLSGVSLIGVDLDHANLSGSNLTFADLEESSFQGACFSGADLSGASFRSACLQDTLMDGATMTGTYFVSASLRGAGIRSANLTNAKLSYSELINVDLTNSDLTGADLYGAELRNARLEFVTGCDVLSFQYMKHYAYYWNGHVKIGCLCFPLEQWLQSYQDHGRRERYSDKEIKVYGSWLRWLRGVREDLSPTEIEEKLS